MTRAEHDHSFDQSERNVLATVSAFYRVYAIKAVSPPPPITQFIAMTDEATLRGVMHAAAERLIELRQQEAGQGVDGGSRRPTGR